MITEIEIRNFKSVSELKVQPSLLNLLTGINSTGKSTFLQALLLLRQSYQHGYFNRPDMKGLLLNNGDIYVNLGTFSDVLHDNAQKEDRLAIKINTASGAFLHFESEAYSSDTRDKSLVLGTLTQYDMLNGNLAALFADKFQYLAAERLGPQDYYPRFTGESKELGKDGRYTPHYLEKFANASLNVPTLANGVDPQRPDAPFLHHVNGWMSEISPGIEIIAKENRDTNRIELSYRYKTALGIPTKERKPYNVGFGITQVLPLVVALLSSEPGDLLLLENPETHLHPRAQSVIGKLIAKTAQAGVQVFLETHSDHILNGILIACRTGDVEHENITALFFEKNPDLISLDVKKVEVLPKGKIMDAPRGFFDQYRIDVRALI